MLETYWYRWLYGTETSPQMAIPTMDARKILVQMAGYMEQRYWYRWLYTTEISAQMAIPTMDAREIGTDGYIEERYRYRWLY
jgi:hypothetical protein